VEIKVGCRVPEVRVATFNVENLFAGPKVLDTLDWKVGKPQSEDAAHSLGRVSGRRNWYAAGVRPFRAVCAPQPLNAVASTSGLLRFDGPS